jgi:RNA recognition motif-containing protein
MMPGYNNYPSSMTASLAPAVLPEEFRTLFLGDLSIHCSRQDVHYLFQPFGNIERITLKVGTSMKGLGYGFLTYTEREHAENAMNTLQGTVVLGRALRLSWATPRGQTHLIDKAAMSRSNIDKDGQTAEVHFSFLTKQVNYLSFFLVFA